VGLRLTKKQIREGLAGHLQGGEDLKFWGYASIVADFAIWKNRFFYAGLSDRRILLQRVGVFLNMKEFSEIRLQDIAEMAYSPIGSSLGQVLALITRSGDKYTLQFQYLIGLENPPVAREMYDYLLAEKRAGRLEIAVVGE